MEIRAPKEILRANGKTLKLVKCSGDIDIGLKNPVRLAIYQECSWNVEVHVLRITPKHNRDTDSSYTHIWATSSNEEFGKFGWSYMSMDRAEAKYASLIETYLSK
jgi:hypothetical protein